MHGRKWTDHLLALHQAVSEVVLTSSREVGAARNPKGDAVRLFDLAANRAAIDYLKQLDVALVLDSEETGRQKLGSGEPQARVVLDPVDGSDNWARGLPCSALSCAVLAPGAQLRPDCVEAGIVGPVGEARPWWAEAGRGAWKGTTRLATSGVTRIVDAMISVELNHWPPPPALARLLAEARGVRSYGCASHALALVASGATDAHIDIRGRLTAESYLAGAFLVIQAGGCALGSDGAPVAAVRGLTDGAALIAAATRELCETIVDGLRP